MLFYKQYKEKLWIYIFNKKNSYLIFSVIIFIFLSFNKAYSINLCDKLAALEADPRKTSKPVLFEDLDAKKIITNCTNDLEKAKNSENISGFYLQRARGFLKIGSINDAISDLNKSYEFGYPAAAFALATLFYLGDDVAQDFELAKKLYFESYNLGVIWAAKGLFFLYSDPNYDGNNEKIAHMWEKVFSQSIIE